MRNTPPLTRRLAAMPPAVVRALLARNPGVAAECVYAIAAEGFAPAQVCIGRMLLAGTGMPADRRAAYRWFTRAAGQGNRDAVNMLGRCFENGWGVAADAGAAALHYRCAAHAGCSWAQYNLGHLHLDGRGTPRDPVRAVAWYRAAAGQGHARAMNLLGRCHEEGWGTARDSAAAAAWYRRSAERGYFRGQYNWATVLQGTGRFAEAARWFERAAAGGTEAVRQCVRAAAAASTVPCLRSLADRLPGCNKESRCSSASPNCST
jgi:TPR repeat protein